MSVLRNETLGTECIFCETCLCSACLLAFKDFLRWVYYISNGIQLEKIQSVSLIYCYHSKFSEKRMEKVIEKKLLPICGNVFTSEGGGWFFFIPHAFSKTTKLRNNLCQNVRIFPCQVGNKGNIPFP